MSISLEKRAEKVGIVLAKRGITKVPPIRVGCATDVSGSAHSFYTSGQMQETLERLMGVALKFDDNGELDMWAFSSSFKKLSVATRENAMSYMKNVLLEEAGSVLWNGTEYSGVLKSMCEFFFPDQPKGFLGGLFGGGKKANSELDPAMVLFITDGANDDRSRTTAVLESMKNKPVYFMMVGIGSPSYFGFLREMAERYDNVGFINLNDLTLSDDDLYEQLVSGEFAAWVKQFVK